MSLVVVGGGPAGRAALALLPGATLLARPEVTVWHAEPGLLWAETSAGVRAVPFTRLLLCADEPLLLLALGCAFATGRPVVDATGATSLPGIYAAGAILGATTPEAAAAQGRIAARALAGLPALAAEDAIPPPPPRPLPEAPRRDPVAMAALLAQPPGPERNAAALAEALRQSPPAPARPVGFAALAALAGPRPDPLPVQTDTERLA